MSDSENSFSVKARNMSALAALCVIVIHAGGDGMGSFAAKVMNHVFGWGLCTFAVPWFFFASGYFFAGHLEEKGWWLRSIRSRLRTLLLPYVVWCSLYACFAAGIEVCRSLEVGRAAMAGMSWRWFIVQGLGLDVSHHPLLVPLWYVRSLLIIVLLSPALVWALRRGRWWIPAAIIPPYVYCCGLHDRYAMPWFLFYSTISLAGWLYFSIGVLARREHWAEKKCCVPTWVCWATALAVICAGRMALFYGMPRVAWSSWLMGIPPLLLAVWRLVPDRAWPKWFVTAAFPVYVMHYFFEHFLESFVFPFAHPSMWAYVLRAVIVAILSFWAAYLLRTFVPRESSDLFGGR